MAEENISQEFRLKNIDETRNYLIEETNRNELMSKKNKKVWTTLNYIEHFLILDFPITACVSISAKSKLNSIEVLISKALIDSVISHDEFVLINNVLKEYNEMKQETKYLKT